MKKKVKTYSWRSLTDILSTLSEQEVKDLLEAELIGDKRATIAIRLHQRYTILRAMRERQEFMKIIND